MRLLLKGEDISPCGSGWFYVELNSNAMKDVYEEQRRQFMIEDIAASVEEKIHERGVGDQYAWDWPARFGEKFASKAIAAIDGNEQIQELYSCTVNRQVEEGLKSHGIDPDTMLFVGETDRKPAKGLYAGDGG